MEIFNTVYMSVLFALSIALTFLVNQPTIQPTYSSIRTFDAIPRTHNRLLNFSSGAGYWVYYLGIAKFIQETYDLDDTDFVGTSAGSFVSVLLANRIPIDIIFHQFALEHIRRCQNNPFGVFGYWNISYAQAILDGCLHFHLQPTRNFAYVGVSRWSRTHFVKLYLDSGLSHETVATTLICSCWIPFITAPFLQPLFRIGNHWYGDGFWTGNDISTHSKHLVIHPNRFERLPLTTYWLWLDPDYNIRLYNLGYQHARIHRQVLDEFFC
jgi:hypothetical protein